MIVNKLKTKVLVFGSQLKANVHFNGKHIEQVKNYKHLGNILTTVQSHKGDIFSKNYDYLSGQSRNIMFRIKKRLKSVGQLPPRIQIHLFENLVRPILLYGSDVMGVNVSANTPIDKLLSYYMRCVLQVKATTSNVIVVGESGQVPPSVYCHINTLCYLKRLHDFPDTKIVEQVYNKLNRLHQCGVKTWVTKACELAEQYQVDNSSKISKNIVRLRFQTVINTVGYCRLRIFIRNPILRCEHILCSKQNSVPRNILKPYLTVATVAVASLAKCRQKYKIYTNLTTKINSFYWCQARTNKLQYRLGNSFINVSISAPGLSKLLRRLVPCFVYLLHPKGHYDTRYWLSADVITKHIPKHDGCCGADSAVAGANGGCHTMTASVSMMKNVQENCHHLKFYWCLNGYLFSSSTVSHDFIFNAVPLTHCCLLYVTCMILWNALSEMTK